MSARRSSEQLRRDALAIWWAGVEAVRSDRLVAAHTRVDRHWLEIGGQRLDMDTIGRIAVVGAGKAGAGMAQGLETALGPELMRAKQLSGWLNVPADCVRPLAHIHLHAARPAGVNEPTEEGVAGSREILHLVESLGADDLCIALVSGGGSALLPYPLDAITLADKLAVTRFLSAAGAPIEELNMVRKHLSRIKGGGLARSCRAGRLVTLVVSDVLGDPLELIASGPTVVAPPTPERALAILHRYGAEAAVISPRVFEALAAQMSQRPSECACAVTNVVIGNNRTAVEAAVAEAQARGYATKSSTADRSEGAAEEIGRQLAIATLDAQATGACDCIISGGEPTVKLVESSRRGLGGRNQQLVLAAGIELQDRDADGILILSAGTDGEDGPTDAAGALVDRAILDEAARRGLDARGALARNDAYHWFEPLGGLIKSGPTDTNVCDVRVALVEKRESCD